ncbi:MAG: hypothetical protein H6742_09580 [Alphaproteobacteria bacterium]|nr:hypothetical protein [Alphaproteobacteria bacterium]
MTEDQKPPASPTTDTSVADARKPGAPPKRELTVDDVESQGTDVKGGGISTSILDVAGLHSTSSSS